MMKITNIRTLVASLLHGLLLCVSLLCASAAQAVVLDLSDQQRADYEQVASALSDVNGSIHTIEGIVSETYWVDAINGVNNYDRTGGIDQPWQSIAWAMNNIPFAKQSANIVIRAGTYSPKVLYIGQQRGGDKQAETPFNIMAFPGDSVRLNGDQVADKGALISIAGAAHVTISGLDLSRVSGSGKSVIYISNSQKIRLVSNEIHHAHWNEDSEAVPTLADRLNGIAVVGDSQEIEIKNNHLHDLMTGYGEPILVLAPAIAQLENNKVHDNDADVFENQQYYVSPTGSDEKGVGSFDKPWKSIHKALFSIPYAEDNATINIRAGTYPIPYALYFEALRGGSEGKYFTLQAYQNEKVVIDGRRLSQAFSAMVSFSSASYVRLKGLQFANLKGPKSGIYMEGSSHHIELINNKLYNMNWADEAHEKPLKPSPADNLNPIAVIGNHATKPMHNIVIRGNELYDIFPGYSEGIKIVGNVTDFLVEKNNIHDIANIGIVAAGNYTWVKDAQGVLIPAAVNHARDGIIRDNTVSYAVSPVANSAGIYLDGAHNVLVKGNRSHNNSVGFSVGCEQPGTTKDNVLSQNIAYENTDAGLVIGTIHAGAVVSNTAIELNEFKHNYRKGGWGGEVTIQAVKGLSLKKNVLVSRSDLMLVAAQAATGMAIDNNLYYGVSENPASAVFDWGGIDKLSYTGLAEFQEKTCHDVNSVYQKSTASEYFAYLDKQKGKAKGRRFKAKGASHRRYGQAQASRIRASCLSGTSLRDKPHKRRDDREGRVENPAPSRHIHHGHTQR